MPLESDALAARCNRNYQPGAADQRHQALSEAVYLQGAAVWCRRRSNVGCCAWVARGVACSVRWGGVHGRVGCCVRWGGIGRRVSCWVWRRVRCGIWCRVDGRLVGWCWRGINIGHRLGGCGWRGIDNRCRWGWRVGAALHLPAAWTLSGGAVARSCAAGGAVAC